MASRVTDLTVSPPKRVRPQLIEATYVMSRDQAMEEAGDIVSRLGHRDHDQSTLVSEMAEWLSEPIIKVLSEEFKNKVFWWCAQYDPEWLETIRGAKEDLLEYRYVSPVEEPPVSVNIDDKVVEKLDAIKEEILRAQRMGLTTIMAKLELQQPQGQTSTTGSPTKRRRVNTRSARNATAEKAEKIHQALRYLLGDKSQLLASFEEFVGSIDGDMLPSNSKPLWSKEELNDLKKEVRAQGVDVIEYKLLDRSLQEMQDGDLPISNLAALARLLVSTDQFKQLAEKFPFPFQCEED